MAKFLTYAHKDTWIHRLCGATKMIFFILWSIVGMVTYDTRILAFMLLFSFVMFYMSKTEYRQVATVFKVIGFFLTINIIAIFFFSPYEGVKIYGNRTDLIHLFGSYTFTREQLFYEFNVILKYFTVIPVALMFIVTTNPSEFAASLNKLGVKFVISNAMELRGFGKHKKRTWYMGRKFQLSDFLSIAFVAVFTIIAIVVTFYDGSRFYNPFL